MDDKKRERYLDKAPQPQRIEGAVYIALALSALFTLSVKAEPAALRSPDATVYEQTSEESSPVGNLVEGGSFEYIGDVTAEDGSVWRQITTANGITGYIKGDREIETGMAQEPALDGQEAQEPPAGEGDNGQPTENSRDEGAQTAQNPGEVPDQTAGEPVEDGGEEEAPEETDEEDTDPPQEAEGGEEASRDDSVIPVFHMQNNQTKKYVTDTSQKIKERVSAAGTDADIKDMAGRKGGIDLALTVAVVMAFLCSGTIYICWRRMKRLKGGSIEAEGIDGNRNRARRKAERKKHSQKRKSTKIIQGKKRTEIFAASDRKKNIGEK